MDQSSVRISHLRSSEGLRALFPYLLFCRRVRRASIGAVCSIRPRLLALRADDVGRINTVLNSLPASFLRCGSFLAFLLVKNRIKTLKFLSIFSMAYTQSHFIYLHLFYTVKTGFNPWVSDMVALAITVQQPNLDLDWFSVDLTFYQILAKRFLT